MIKFATRKKYICNIQWHGGIVYESTFIYGCLYSNGNTLSERERKVICMRFGLYGEPVRTLEQVGKELDCTNERVRQIQNIALKKLHNRMVKLK